MRTPTGIAGLLAAVVATVFSGFSVVATAPVASAHAELVSSSPRSGATVRQLPSRVTLTFSETISTPAFVEVTGPDGANVATGEVGVRDDQLTSRLGDSDVAGAYAMSYRITSADGHPISGTVRFRVQGGAQGSERGADEQSPPATAGAGEAGQDTPAAPAGDTGGGLSTTQLVLLLAALLVGLAVLAVGTRRALRHSMAMADDAKNKRTRKG
jgi:copper resistance protein C